MIQQNVAGRPVTVFRFPPRTRLKALTHATVSLFTVLCFNNLISTIACVCKY